MENLDLFGNPVPAYSNVAKKKGGNWHRQLLQQYGQQEGKTCKNCIHLKRFKQSASWLKCAIADPTFKSGNSGDWRAGWQACGKYQESMAANIEDNGARFSKCRKHRLYLWRIWDQSLPYLMIIGLNPSTANADEDDPTIRKVKAIARHNGYGGIYMTNLFTYISTDPTKLDMVLGNHQTSDHILMDIRSKCKDVCMAWGAFKVFGRDEEVKRMFSETLALKINRNGSPKHPLYCKDESRFINYDNIANAQN